MKLSKEELKAKINEVVTDEDVKILLLEDVEDSFEVVEEVKEDETEKVSKEDYEKVIAERDEIKKKYKERFLSGSEESKEDENEAETLHEEEVIDVKEI